MRNGSGIPNELVTTTAVHVSDFDLHVRAMRAANAEMRDRIAALRAQISRMEEIHDRQRELQRALGERVLAVERELGRAQVRAEEHVAAIEAAADEEVRCIIDTARAQTTQLRQAIDALIGSPEPADVVVLTPRPVAGGEAADRSVSERSVAM